MILYDVMTGLDKSSYVSRERFIWCNNGMFLPPDKEILKDKSPYGYMLTDKLAVKLDDLGSPTGWKKAKKNCGMLICSGSKGFMPNMDEVRIMRRNIPHMVIDLLSAGLINCSLYKNIAKKNKWYTIWTSESLIDENYAYCYSPGYFNFQICHKYNFESCYPLPFFYVKDNLRDSNRSEYK